MTTNKKTHKTTIKDVANQTGYSISTVSHVLNRTATISEPTRRKILEVVQQLDYVPNGCAKIRNSDMPAVGVLVPDIGNEYYAKIVQSIFCVAYDAGYNVVLCDMSHDYKREYKQVQLLLEHAVKGLIFVGGAMDSNIILEASRKVPIVLGDRKLDDISFPTVETDNILAMRKLIATLKSWGYSKIGFLCEALYMSNVADRFAGFKMGLEENNLPLLNSLIFLERRLMLDKLNSSYELTKSMLASRSAKNLPEVLVTSSDLLAIGAMRAYREHGLRVPDDIGVVGFDNLPIASFVQPMLTTIEQDVTQIGVNCFKKLFALIQSPSQVATRSLIEAKLIVRDSVRQNATLRDA